MSKEEKGKEWRGVSEEIIVGIWEWRDQNPQASFGEIEAELDRRLSELRARMLADVAVASAKADWEAGSESVVCPNCGAALQPNGKKKRTLQTRGGREVKIEREYGVCPQCGQRIFPPG
jgi:YgiT-type zinc finger domain-containing protein